MASTFSTVPPPTFVRQNPDRPCKVVDISSNVPLLPFLPRRGRERLRKVENSSNTPPPLLLLRQSSGLRRKVVDTCSYMPPTTALPRLLEQPGRGGIGGI